MIVSASRRTDVPAFYGDWFMERIREGFLRVANPYNTRQIRVVDLRPEAVDAFVFWSKNPRPFFSSLNELDRAGYKYYFQFTITPYGTDIEPGLPPKEELVQTFLDFSRRIGSRRMVLRVDPLLLTTRYSFSVHETFFRWVCGKLQHAASHVTISFLNHYRRNSVRLRQIGAKPPEPADMQELASRLAPIAKEKGLSMESCAEAEDFSRWGIRPGSCVDAGLIETLTGQRVNVPRARGNRRPHCLCDQSVDIGQYNTCRHGCLYCYATNAIPAEFDKNITKPSPIK